MSTADTFEEFRTKVLVKLTNTALSGHESALILYFFGLRPDPQMVANLITALRNLKTISALTIAENLVKRGIKDGKSLQDVIKNLTETDNGNWGLNLFYNQNFGPEISTQDITPAATINPSGTQ